jgi:putative heme-binding domain-containing protein
VSEYLQAKHPPLRLEAVRSLAQQTNPKRFELLASLAKDDSQSDEVRAEAIVGLSAAAEQNRDLLEKLATGKQAAAGREAERALRLTGLRPAAAESKPPADDVAAWKELLSKPGDAAAGHRLFFNPAGPHCSVCHKHSGRGGNVGPDLSEVGRSTPREKIMTSILQPSQEIAPDYQPWVLVTSEGKTYTGLRLPKVGDDGTERFADANGKYFTLPIASIEERHVAGKSIMPDNLQSTLSIDDLRDLVTFLAGGQSIGSDIAK